MRTLQPVIWSPGTFLSPQHLQVEDRFIQSTLQFRLDALAFRPWGFKSLRVDPEALANGIFTLSQGTGILPDGLLFDVPACDRAPDGKPLAEYFDPDQEYVDAWLAVPEYRERGVNVSLPQRGLDTRFLIEVASFRDENTGTSERPIQVARKNLQLLIGERRKGVSAMPVARIRRAADTYQLDSHFVPPLLDISASDYLLAIARRLLEILGAKSSMLAGMRRQKNQSLAEFTVSDIANFWLLYTVNTHLPCLRHIFEKQRGHPERLFAVMLGLAAALTTFSMKVQATDLPEYDHEELGKCFSELDEKLLFLLETVVPSNFVAFPLRLVRNAVYAASVAEDRYLNGTKMYLAISAEMDTANLIQKTPDLVKVCSATHVEHLIRQALPGVPLTHVMAPPASIPIKVNYQYFSLSQAGLAWEAIVRTRNVAAYVPGDFPNPQLELLVVLPESIS